MAKYRQVHTTFWDDGFVIDLTPEEKYFYLYLMTNNNTTQCGIYELPYRVIEMHTGYNRDTVLKLLERFKEYGKIAYNESTKEIILLNWGKYNFINSPKVKKCIEKELQSVKHKPFVNLYLNSLAENGYHIDTVSIGLSEFSREKVSQLSNGEGSIPYAYPIDSPCIDLGEEKEQEKEQEEEKEQQQEKGESASPSSPGVVVPSLVDQDYKKLQDYCKSHMFFRNLTFEENKDLSDLLDEFTDTQLIIAAIDIATQNGKFFIGYPRGILRRWKADGITNHQQLAQIGGKSNGSSTGSNGKGNGRTPEEDAILSKLKNYNSADYR